MISQVVVHTPLDILEIEFSVGDSTSPTQHSGNLSVRWWAVLMIWHLVGGSQGFEIFRTLKNQFTFEWLPEIWLGFPASRKPVSIELSLPNSWFTNKHSFNIHRHFQECSWETWWLCFQGFHSWRSTQCFKRVFGGNVCPEHGQIFFSHHHSLSNTSWWPWACHGHWTLEMMESIRENGVGWLWLLQHFLQGTLRTSSGPWRTSVFKVWSSVVD